MHSLIRETHQGAYSLRRTWASAFHTSSSNVDPTTVSTGPLFTSGSGSERTYLTTSTPAAHRSSLQALAQKRFSVDVDVSLRGTARRGVGVLLQPASLVLGQKVEDILQ